MAPTKKNLVLALSEICRHISDSGGFRLGGRTRELVHGRQLGCGQPLCCGDQPVANSVPNTQPATYLVLGPQLADRRRLLRQSLGVAADTTAGSSPRAIVSVQRVNSSGLNGAGVRYLPVARTSRRYQPAQDRDCL